MKMLTPEALDEFEKLKSDVDITWKILAKIPRQIVSGKCTAEYLKEPLRAYMEADNKIRAHLAEYWLTKVNRVN